MKKFKKAYTAAAVGLAGALGTALTDGDISTKEALASVGVALLAGAAVYKVTNEG